MTSPGTGEPDERTPRAEGGAAPPPSSPRPATAPPTPTRSETHAVPHAAGGLGGDWPAQAADLVVSSVDRARDRTTEPIQTAARGVVYGLLAAVLGTMVLILLLVASVRGLDTIVGIFVDPPHIWITYLLLGLVFSIAGVAVFRRRRLAES